MAALANLVGFTTNTTGTSTTLAVVAAIQGLRTPAGAGLADGVYSYGIKTGASGSENYEVGTVTIGSSGASITGRTLVNSTTGSLLNLSGTSEVYITDLAADHPTSTDGLLEGITNLYFTDGRVRSATLNGVETTITDSAIVNGDSVLTAIRKLIARCANALSRANHTGTQAISTVSGLQTALDGKAPVPVTIATSGNVTLTSANSGAIYENGSTSRQFTVGTGIGDGFVPVLVLGPSTWVASGVTINDYRQTGQTNPIASLIRTGTNTFRLEGRTT